MIGKWRNCIRVATLIQISLQSIRVAALIQISPQSIRVATLIENPLDVDIVDNRNCLIRTLTLFQKTLKSIRVLVVTRIKKAHSGGASGTLKI